MRSSFPETTVFTRVGWPTPFFWEGCFWLPYATDTAAKPITTIPSDYLEWMVREKHPLARRAARELDRQREIRAAAGGTL